MPWNFPGLIFPPTPTGGAFPISPQKVTEIISHRSLTRLSRSGNHKLERYDNRLCQDFHYIVFVWPPMLMIRYDENRLNCTTATYSVPQWTTMRNCVSHPLPSPPPLRGLTSTVIIFLFIHQKFNTQSLYTLGIFFHGIVAIEKTHSPRTPVEKLVGKKPWGKPQERLFATWWAKKICARVEKLHMRSFLYFDFFSSVFFHWRFSLLSQFQSTIKWIFGK